MDRATICARILTATGEIVAAVRPEQLDGPTPCGAWTLRQLLGHMVGHNVGWAAAAAGDPVGAEAWDRLDVTDPAAEYDAAAAAVAAAFAAPAADPIEVYGYGTLPLSTGMAMHIVDYVVHGWDVARSIGYRWHYDEELVDAAYRIMLRFPTSRPNKAFDVIVPVADDAPVTDKLMAYVGRDPQWSPPR
jgi:uncharacterized protein (TIGR03086 family)